MSLVYINGTTAYINMVIITADAIILSQSRILCSVFLLHLISISQQPYLGEIIKYKEADWKTVRNLHKTTKPVSTGPGIQILICVAAKSALWNTAKEVI